MNLRWIETEYQDIYVNGIGKVLNRKTGHEFVGPIIEVLPGKRVQRAELVLRTLDPPPLKNCRFYVRYRDNDPFNWNVTNLYWSVDARDLLRAAQEADDEELAKMTPTLLQLVPVVVNDFYGIDFEAHPDIFHTH